MSVVAYAPRLDEPKRRRLQGLLRIKGCPDATLNALKDQLRRDPQLLTVSCKQTRIARAKIMGECSARGELVLQGGDTQCWVIADVGRTLNFFLARVDDFRAVLAALYKRTPCTFDRPWTLVFYYDETVPVDGVRLDQTRKLMSIYTTIRELEPFFTKHTLAWIPTGYLRTSLLKRVDGGSRRQRRRPRGECYVKKVTFEMTSSWNRFTKSCT